MELPNIILRSPYTPHSATTGGSESGVAFSQHPTASPTLGWRTSQQIFLQGSGAMAVLLLLIIQFLLWLCFCVVPLFPHIRYHDQNCHGYQGGYSSPPPWHDTLGPMVPVGDVHRSLISQGADHLCTSGDANPDPQRDLKTRII